MKPVVKKLMHGVVISCQAYEDTPLYGADNMARMAESAEIGGASGIRACWPQDIKAIKKAVDLPIIGIYKSFSKGDPLDDIFITPDFESAEKIIAAGCDILGLDCTIRPNRTLNQLTHLLKEIKTHYPDMPIMADLATEDEAMQVAASGLVDIISTTLSGYTRQSQKDLTEGPNIELVKKIKTDISLPVNAEGRIWDLNDLHKVLTADPDMVTIGSAVTRPQLITKHFVDFNTKYYNNVKS